MKLNVKKDDLLTGLQRVQPAVAARTTLPVLGNILVRADGERVQLTASDLAMTVMASMPAVVAKGGATTLPARRLAAIARETAGSEIELETNEREVTTLRSASAVFHLNGIAAEDFPALPKIADARTFTMEREVLRSMLQRTSYAASSDESRQVLNGVLMAFRDGRLTVVATDGRRLAMVEQEVEMTKDAAELIVPTKAVSEIILMLDGQGPVTLNAMANMLAVDAGDTVLYSRLVEGTFPNYRQVIPGQCEERIALERESFMNAVRRVALLTNETNNAVKLTIGRNKIDITAQTPDVGEAKESVPVKYSGKDVTVSFNPGFITDALKNLVADQVYLEFNDETSPGVIKTDEPFLYVIMPMRMS
jgi:DNA polymerase-3 subunit beta